jgi:hypothetical protein
MVLIDALNPKNHEPAREVYHWESEGSSSKRQGVRSWCLWVHMAMEFRLAKKKN